MPHGSARLFGSKGRATPSKTESTAKS